MRFSREVSLECCGPAPRSVSDSDVVEISLLLPGWQALELEKEAHHRGLTAAQMVRHLLGQYLTRV
jgi:hypothetical protein